MFLLAAFSFPLIGPALIASDAESNLPSCCRRAGKHHCAMIGMADGQDLSSGAAARATREKCPKFPTSGAVPGYSKTVLLKSALTLSASLTSLPAVQSQAEARYRASFSRSRQKRGPPILLS
jgi:hypothetical protein